MPLARLERARRTLPEGYQFGQTRGLAEFDLVWRRVPVQTGPTIAVRLPNPWRARHENAADQLARSAQVLKVD